jgi:serine/threonine-protein kinase HipA
VVARNARPRALGIWVNGERLGSWTPRRSGPSELRYDDAWLSSKAARPLSLSLPLPIDAVPLRSKAVDYYFDNLLPESEPIRRRIQERFRTPTRGPFDLLAAIGRDCVGAVQLMPGDEAPPRIDRIEAERLSEKDIAGELSWFISAKGPAPRDDELRISIAGAQQKTAFTRHQGRWCRPMGSTPTTHIFKLPIGLFGGRRADMTTSVEIEWLCGRILKAFGLPVANCEIDTFGPHKVLIVERFDRQLHSSGRYWLRLMQEDFAQATATPWHGKYESDGGPGVEQIGAILGSSLDPKADLATLFKAQVLFCMLAATDGHAKNFSIRLMAGAQFKLTPLYDVVSMWPVIGKKANEFPWQKTRLAMSLPGTRRHCLLASIQRRHFLDLGKKLGLEASGEPLVDELVAKTPAVLLEVQQRLPRGFPQTVLDRVLEGVEKAAKSYGS